MERTKPIHVEKSGLVEAAVFENVAKDGGRYYRVTMTRLYKNADGKWRNRTGFSAGDLANVALVAAKVGIFLEPLTKPRQVEDDTNEAVNE